MAIDKAYALIYNTSVMKYLDQLRTVDARSVAAGVLIGLGALTLSGCDPMGAQDEMDKERQAYNACIAEVGVSIAEETGGPIPDESNIPMEYVDQCHLEAFGSEG